MREFNRETSRTVSRHAIHSATATSLRHMDLSGTDIKVLWNKPLKLSCHWCAWNWQTLFTNSNFWLVKGSFILSCGKGKGNYVVSVAVTIGQRGIEPNWWRHLCHSNHIPPSPLHSSLIILDLCQVSPGLGREGLAFLFLFFSLGLSEEASEYFIWSKVNRPLSPFLLFVARNTHTSEN